MLSLVRAFTSKINLLASRIIKILYYNKRLNCEYMKVEYLGLVRPTKVHIKISFPTLLEQLF